MTTSTEPLLTPQATAALRDVLLQYGYTRDGIVTRIGIEAAHALNRYDPEPALQLLGESDPLGVLIRLFMCGRGVPIVQVDEAVVPLLEPAGEGLVRAAVYLHPYEKWWAVSDFPLFLRPEARDRRADRVLPIGPTATLLRRATLGHRVGTALDLGTGCGVQALHLSDQADTVVATDLSARAARFAATTAALNELDWEVLEGDMTQPVAGRRFDLVVSNPPYAVGPGTVHCVYRDSGRPGDAMCAELVAAAPDLLTEGGHLQFRANWAHVAGEDWHERVAHWLPADSGLDAWIVQRGVTDARAYVDHWLEQSGGEEHLGQRESWLRWFEDRKITGVGTGTVVLRRTDRHDPVVRIEELSPEAAELTGAQVADWFTRQDWLRDHDPLTAHFRPGPGVRLWQEAGLRPDSASGPGGWHLNQQLLKIPSDGLNWNERTTPLGVALIGGSGRPDETLGDQLTRLAEAEGTDRSRLVLAALPEVARLVERGALIPGAIPGAIPG
ncbi:methyltransferase [Streptomyces mesophilus]|uniref:methyltransferase n=1 Tax=Streptomyces mesophilus TaxID=1775132 RepID=UPI0033318836